MRVTDCMAGGANLSALEAAEAVNFTREHPGSVPPAVGFLELAFVGAMCNAGEFDASTSHLPLENRAIFGDATDQAVLRFVEGLHSVSKIRSLWKVVHKIPFNSKNKFMAYALQPSNSESKEPDCGSSTAQMTLVTKGAPDILLPRCTKFMSEDGSTMAMTDEVRSNIEETKDRWSQQAKRVILLARRPSEVSTKAFNTSQFDEEVLGQVGSELEFVGLVAVIDPPRDEIPEVIRTLRTAGIKVHMVTGDFRLTAQAIAAECGIITQLPDRVDDVSALAHSWSPEMSILEGMPDADKFSTNYLSKRSLVISGSEMMALTNEQWDVLCKYDEIVFARTTPEQKLRIVRELQARGETVGSK